VLQLKPLPSKPFEPIVRERLVERLAELTQYRIALVEAPAGFGKSIAVRHYLEQRRIDFIHYPMREENGTLPGFLRGFVTAIGSRAPHAAESLPGAIEHFERTSAPVSEVGEWLATFLREYAGTIFIDDFHHAEKDTRASAALVETIHRSPSAVRWIIGTRDPLDLPEASWIGYGLSGLPVTEADLTLTEQEGLDVAERSGVLLRLDEIRDLVRSTCGWPVAFVFALRASTQAADLTRVSEGARELLYAFLAEQVIRHLDPDECKFLEETALMPSLDAALLDACGFVDSASMLDRIRHRTAFVTTDAEGTLRYHDLFQAFLKHRLKMQGVAKYATICEATAVRMLAIGSIAEATQLYTDVGFTAPLADIIAKHGLALFDSGSIDLLDQALAILPAQVFEERPALLIVAGACHSSRGRYTQAEASFRHAASIQCDTNDQINLACRYGTLLIFPFQRFAEAYETIPVLSDSSVVDEATRVQLLSQKASLLATLGKLEEAVDAGQRASQAAFATRDSCLQLRVLVNGCQLEIEQGNSRRVIALANDVIAKAKRLSLPVAIHAAMTMMLRANYDLGELDKCHEIAVELQQSTEAYGDKKHGFYCTVVNYEIATMKGDVETLRRLDPIVLNELSRLPATFSALNRAFAWRQAYDGNFRTAYSLIADLEKADRAPCTKVMTSSERLLYAAAAGLRTEALEAATEILTVTSALTESQAKTFRAQRSQLLAAVGLMLIGRNTAANEILRSFELARGQLSTLAFQLLRTVRAMYIKREVGNLDSTFDTEQAALRSTPIGGLAIVFELLGRRERAPGSSFSRLTPTELSVLRVLSTGVTSRRAAVLMKCGASTIDAHAKSISRKIGCRSRAEAIALARAIGIV